MSLYVIYIFIMVCVCMCVSILSLCSLYNAILHANGSVG